MATVLFVGDSITAGVFVPEDRRYSSLVIDELNASGLDVNGINAGVPGEISERGRGRLPELLEHKPQVVTIAYGMNDSVLVEEGTFRVPPEKYRAEIESMLAMVKETGAKPLLIATPPVRPQYYHERHPKAYYEPYGGVNAVIDQYNSILKSLGVPVADIYTPFLPRVESLQRGEGDGVHPNEEGHKVMAEVITPIIRELLVQDA